MKAIPDVLQIELIMKNKINKNPQLNGTNELINPKKTTFWEKWRALEDTQVRKKTM